jgi:hypothetical protein
MASKKKIQANQKNALKSTGPKTTQGLQVVSQNAVQHGVYSKISPVLSHEDEQAYQENKQQLVLEFNATTFAELALIEKMAQCLWKKQRLVMLEQQMIRGQQAHQVLSQQEKQLAYQCSSGAEKSTSCIRQVQAAIQDLSECIEACEKFNRIRSATKRNKEAEFLLWQLQDAINSVKSGLSPFLEESDWREAQKGEPISLTGQVAKGILFNLVSVQHFEDEMDSCQGYSTYSLSHLIEALKQWLERLQQKSELVEQRLELNQSLESIGADFMLNEANQRKLELYESHLDNQFYKALHELQKLQAFNLQKRQCS